MSIIRAARPQSNFYILDKQISEDRRLSWSARGLLIFLLGKPDHWQVSVEALLNCGPDKKGNRKEAIYGYISELIVAGYITRKKLANGSMDYLVSESPSDVVMEEPDWANPDLGNPYQANPNLGYPTLVSIDGKEVLKEAKTRPAPRAIKTQLPDGFSVSDRVTEWAAEKGHDRLALRLEYFVGYAKASGAKYTDWDQAFMNSIRDNWAKLPIVSQEAKPKFRGLK